MRDYGAGGWKYSQGSINLTFRAVPAALVDLLNDLLCDDRLRNI